jgi:hypothetical protein
MTPPASSRRSSERRRRREIEWDRRVRRQSGLFSLLVPVEDGGLGGRWTDIGSDAHNRVRRRFDQSTDRPSLCRWIVARVHDSVFAAINIVTHMISRAEATAARFWAASRLGRACVRRGDFEVADEWACLLFKDSADAVVGLRAQQAALEIWAAIEAEKGRVGADPLRATP